jgi:Holliday junction resolvase RusA-like endonuclease
VTSSLVYPVGHPASGVHFEVLGLPYPQGDKSAALIAGKARLIEGRRDSGRAKHRSWRGAVAEAAHDVAEHPDVNAPLDGPLELIVTFRLPMPPSRPKRLQARGAAWQITRPDLSKLIRSTEDALQDAGLIRDDARICYVEARKLEVVGWTGAQITVRRTLREL